jgi:hypothetical protein
MHLYHRVLHANTEAADLRDFLKAEWGTISVVSGLFVILMGTSGFSSALGAGFSPATADEPPGYTALRYVFLATSTLSYICSVSACLVSLTLLHASNAVPQSRLHAFLRKTHCQLWVPLGALLSAVALASIALSCASLIIYQSWVVFAVRLGVILVWLGLLGALLLSLSRAAQRCSGGAQRGPPAAPAPPTPAAPPAAAPPTAAT